MKEETSVKGLSQSRLRCPVITSFWHARLIGMTTVLTSFLPFCSREIPIWGILFSLRIWFRNLVVMWAALQLSGLILSASSDTQGYYHGYLLTELSPSWGSRQLCSHRTSQHFMEPKGSIPCSQDPSIGPYLEPYQSNPHHPNLSL
jgi:hypothetical protein